MPVPAAHCFTHGQLYHTPRAEPRGTENRTDAQAKEPVEGSWDQEPGLSGPRVAPLLPALLCPRIRLELIRIPSATDRGAHPSRNFQCSTLPRESKDARGTPPLPPALPTATSRGPQTHLLSRQAKAWKPRLPLLSRGARHVHHTAIPVLRLGQR